MQQVRPSRLSAAAAWWSVAALALSACGEPGVDPNYQMPPGFVLASDAQVLVDSGVRLPDAGGVAPVLPMDAQVAVQPVLDAQLPVFDAQIVAPVEAGLLADTGASLGDGAVADASRPPRMDLGKGSGSDVITIGDSWMLLFFTGIQESLVAASGNQPYRRYGVPGTRLLDGVIPGQYTSAKRADPNIKTVVMTGGGNDIIQSDALKMDCAAGGAMCQAQLDKIGQALLDLWTQMSKDGVQDVIHVMYAAAAGDGVKNREENNKKLAETCATVPPPLRCHLLSTDALITKADLPDNIHPDAEGYDRIGQAVWDLMVKEGMRR